MRSKNHEWGREHTMPNGKKWLNASCGTPVSIDPEYFRHVHSREPITCKKCKARASKKFTCNSCGVALTCKYAWDDYNTNGDCLAEK
jgi:hypothetical protein